MTDRLELRDWSQPDAEHTHPSHCYTILKLRQAARSTVADTVDGGCDDDDGDDDDDRDDDHDDDDDHHHHDDDHHHHSSSSPSSLTVSYRKRV